MLALPASLTMTVTLITVWYLFSAALLTITAQDFDHKRAAVQTQLVTNCIQFYVFVN